MKPINLKLKGLNSYMDEQEIDFESLCSKGLFGIFGPTGCGKSTILDGITIALYGASGMARDTKDFINTEEKKAVIKYIFSLKNNEGKRTYDISRSFKNSKTGVSNDMAKLIVSDESGEIIEVFDKAKEVNTYLEDLLGLTAADFMRSVVLPQGKFSEFLKLKDADRRRMIERLLNLQEFGVKLADKIKRQKEALKSRIEHLDGSINALSLEDDESIELLDLEVKKLRADLKNTEEEYKKSVIYLQKIKEIYNKTNELGELSKKQLLLDDKKEYIDNLKANLLKGGEAAKIKPIYIEYRDEDELLKIIEEKLTLLNEAFEKSQSDNNRLKKIYDEKAKDKDDNMPNLVTLEAKLDEMSKLADENEKSIISRDSLRKEYKELSISYEVLEKNYDEAEKFIASANKEIIDLEKIRDENFIETDYKTKSVQLKSKSDRHKSESDKLNKLKVTKDELKIESEKVKNKYANLEPKVDGIAKELKLKTDKHISDDKSHRDKSDEYHKVKNSILEVKNTSSNYKEKLNQKEEFILENKALVGQLREIEKELGLKSKDLAKLDEDLKTSKSKYEEVKLSLMLNKLTSKLENDKECPLCGSYEHPHIHESVVDNNDYEKEIEKITSKRDDVKLKLSLLKKDKELNQSAVEKLSVKIEELREYTEPSYNDLLTSYKKLLDEQSSLKEATKTLENTIKISKESIIHLENDFKIKSGELTELKSKSENLITRLSECEKNIDLTDKEVKEVLNYIDGYLKESKFESVEKVLEDVSIKENILEETESKLKVCRQDLLEKQKSQKDMQIKKEETYKTMTIIKEKGSSLSEFIKNNEKKIKEVSENDPRSELKAIKNKIIILNDSYDESKKNYEENNEKYIRLEKDKNDLSTKLNVSSERIVKLKSSLDSLIDRSTFEGIDQYKSSIMTDEDMQRKSEELSSYENEKLLLESSIIKLKDELKGESCDKERYDLADKANDDLTKKLSDEKESLTIKETRLTQLEKNAKALKLIIKEKNELLNKQGIVNEISKLTNGNKFVEFVAINHLRYIAKDASARLLDITNGRYSLELDHNGAFVICDNYNGGVKRSCQSLSGGETFMTSLSLALALSTHIQLKGAATLEFFILDEGFGTLDVDLLDTVMNSLEKLRSKNISVGVISHVEELKNRVPMRLSVSPAEPGLHGTKVKIESN